MNLPLPTFSFTIPSVHDDTILNCRLYLPRKGLFHGTNSFLKAAIIAPPYAPLGGSYDDPVVASVGGRLMKDGYIVGTFNFRGAAGSAGCTTWKAHSELEDYVSFYGFMIHYMSGLSTGEHSASGNVKEPPAPVRSGVETVKPGGHSDPQPRLILAGYSYGSMIASHLPDLIGVINVFENAADGSAACEIKLRACYLSSQTLSDIGPGLWGKGRRDDPKVPGPETKQGSSNSSSILVGGFESEAAEQRIGQDSRYSLDFRRSLDRVHGKIQHRLHRRSIDNDKPVEDVRTDVKSTVIVPRICYLLISPILPPIATFATFFSTLSFKVGKVRESQGDISSDDADHQLAKYPSLAVYGGGDIFTSVKKLRNWAREMGQIPGSRFQSYEVEGAGHFWRESDDLERLNNYIKTWEGSFSF